MADFHVKYVELLGGYVVACRQLRQSPQVSKHAAHSCSCHKLKYLRASYELPMVLLAEGCVSASCPPEGEKISPEGTPCKTPGSPPSCMLPLLDLLLSGCDKAQIFKTLGLCFHTDFRS